MATDDIIVRFKGGDRTFTPESTVAIGRDPSCDLVLDNQRVSRRHAELRHTSRGWMFHDLGSTRGSFVGDTQVTEQVLDRSITISLGGLNEGESVDFIVAQKTSFAPPPPTTSGPVDPTGPNVAVPPPPPPPTPGGGPDRPGGSLREEPVAPTVVTGQSINVQCAGRSYTFPPGKEIVIGRDPGADVVVDNPVVSRRHASIRSTGSGWELADFGSSSGTYVDGERITSSPLRGQVAIYLGPEDVGERVVVVTAGPTAAGRKRRSGAKGSRKLVLVALLVSFVAIAAAVAAFVTRDNGSGGPDLDKLREATVFITAGDRSGSGAVISDDGLILTAAHVVAPDALGQGVLRGELNADLPRSPEEVQISVVRGDTTEPAYIGRVVAEDGYLDLAVVRITGTIGGTLVNPGDDLDLQTVPLGDSEDLQQGDDLVVVGYPGVTDTAQANISNGTVNSFLADERLSDNKAWINTDALLAPGSSGGLAADDNGRLIGTPAQVRSEDTTGARVGRIRPSHFAQPLIDKAMADETYESPYVRPKATNTSVEPQNWVEPTDSEGYSLGCDQSETVSGPSGSTFAFSFDYANFPVDAHQDLLAVVTDDRGDFVGGWTSADEWPVEWGTGKGCAILSFELDEPLDDGAYTLSFFAGGNYEEIDSFDFLV